MSMYVNICSWQNFIFAFLWILRSSRNIFRFIFDFGILIQISCDSSLRVQDLGEMITEQKKRKIWRLNDFEQFRVLRFTKCVSYHSPIKIFSFALQYTIYTRRFQEFYMLDTYSQRETKWLRSTRYYFIEKQKERTTHKHLTSVSFSKMFDWFYLLHLSFYSSSNFIISHFSLFVYSVLRKSMSRLMSTVSDLYIFFTFFYRVSSKLACFKCEMLEVWMYVWI